MLAQSGIKHYSSAMKITTDRGIYLATDQLKIRIREQGRNSRWIAKQLGLSESHFSRVLSGERWVAEHHARLVASLLGVDFFVLWKVATSTNRLPSEQQGVPAA
jgi:lambda repressor-like predicted transcriptional regulator